MEVSGREKPYSERGSDKWNELLGDRAIGDAVETAWGLDEIGARDGRIKSKDIFERRDDHQERGAPLAMIPGADGISEVVTSPRADKCGGAGADTRMTGAEVLVEDGAGRVDDVCGGRGGMEEGINIAYGKMDAVANETWHSNNSRCVMNIKKTDFRGAHVGAQTARTIKIWDPVKQLELFSSSIATSADELHCSMPGKNSGCSRTGFDSGSVNDRRTGPGINTEANTSASGGEAPLSAGSAGSSGSGGSSSKPAGRAPVQPGRAAWSEDGETLFMLSHEGMVVGDSCPLGNRSVDRF